MALGRPRPLAGLGSSAAPPLPSLRPLREVWVNFPLREVAPELPWPCLGDLGALTRRHPDQSVQIVRSVQLAPSNTQQDRVRRSMQALPELTPEQFNQVAAAIIGFLAVCGAFKLLRRVFW